MYNIHANQVNAQANEFPSISSRAFDGQIAVLGKQHKIFIDIEAELRSKLGKCYDYVMYCIKLTRQFGHGFHFSNDQFIGYTKGAITDRTLKRRKVEASEYVTISHTVKNRTQYFLNTKWFKGFIFGVLNKLGIQQGQSGPSHIISIDSTLSNDHHDPLDANKTNQKHTPTLNSGLISNLVAIGMFWGVARKMINRLGEDLVRREFDFVMSNKNYRIKGAALYTILKRIIDKGQQPSQHSVSAIYNEKTYEQECRRLEEKLGDPNDLRDKMLREFMEKNMVSKSA